jgi:hypothetical protein
VTTQIPQTPSSQPGNAPTVPSPEAYVSTDAGSSWQALVLPPDVVLDTAFTCPTVDECMVGALVGQTIDSNLSVIQGNGPPPTFEKQLLLTTTDRGSTWSEHAIPIAPALGSNPAFDPALSAASGELNQLTCFTATTCDGFGLVPSDQEEEPIGTGNTVVKNVFVQTTDGGTTWSTYDFPWVANPDGSPGWSNMQPASFSCATAGDCVGLSSVMTSVVNNSQVSTDFSWATTDGGATWNRVWLPNVGGTMSMPRSVSCADSSHCVAIGSFVSPTAGVPASTFIAVTTDGGSSWTIEPQTGDPNSLFLSVACADHQHCWAVGTDNRSEVAQMIASSDGGATWIPVQVPPLAGIEGIDCLPPGSCYAIGYGSFGPGTPSTEVITNASG